MKIRLTKSMYYKIKTNKNLIILLMYMEILKNL
jgi:hypothetical protein